jgi:hypothetical protein
MPRQAGSQRLAGRFGRGRLRHHDQIGRGQLFVSQPKALAYRAFEAVARDGSRDSFAGYRKTEPGMVFLVWAAEHREKLVP